MQFKNFITNKLYYVFIKTDLVFLLRYSLLSFFIAFNR